MRSEKRNPQTFQQRPRSKESTSEVQTASSQKSIRMVRGGFRTILAGQKTTQSRELRLTRRLSFMSAESHFPPTLFQAPASKRRSEEHTSELQSRRDLVCRLLLEKKKKKKENKKHQKKKKKKKKEKKKKPKQ